jgi:hypothetical protein
MQQPDPATDVRSPWSIRLVVTFLLALSACKLVVLLGTCVRAETITQRVLLEAILHGLFALIALLLGVHLLLRLPFGRACAFGFFCSLPLVKGLRYALLPLEWQLAGVHRLQDILSAAILLGLAFVLFRKDAGAYLSTAPEAPRKSPPSPEVAPAPSAHATLDPEEPERQP